MQKKEIDWIAVGVLCTAMMVWASSFIALKVAIGPIGPLSVIFLRMFIGSLCFLVFLKSFMKIEFRKEDIKYLALMVAFEPCLYFLFEAKALQYTSASQAGMITSLAPLITAFVAGVFLKEIITKQLVLGSSLAVLGAIWLSLSADVSENASNPLLGNFLEFMAMISGALYTIAVRHLSSRFSALFLTALQSFVGVVFFAPFALWEYYNVPMEVTQEALLWVVYLGVVVTVGGYGLFNYALSRIEASKAAVYINLIPVFAVIMAFLILDERLSMVEITASAVILSGVFISQVTLRKKIKVKP